MASITITTDVSTAVRFAAAVGNDYNLLDANGVRRSATPAECKQWFIDRALDAINANELPVMQKAVLATVSVPIVSMT